MPVSTVSIPVGQWFTSAEGTLVVRLRLVRARLRLHRRAWAAPPRGERLHAPDDLTAWLRERFPVAVGAARSRDLFDAISLRDAIGRMALAPAHDEPVRAHDIDLVNLYAATPDIPPALAGGSRQAGRSVQTVGQALSTIARDAVDLFDPANAGRIRECTAATAASSTSTPRARRPAGGARCSAAATARRCARTAPARRTGRAPDRRRGGPRGAARVRPVAPRVAPWHRTVRGSPAPSDAVAPSRSTVTRSTRRARSPNPPRDGGPARRARRRDPTRR